MTEQKAKDLKAFYRYDADHPFAAMYPLLAKQIVDDCGVTNGRCLDIGTGSGALLIELGKITGLELIGLDINPETLTLAGDTTCPGRASPFCRGMCMPCRCRMTTFDWW